MPQQSNRISLMDINVIDDVRERDMFSTDFALGFRAKRGVRWRKIQSDEVGRPDLISFREYGNVGLWWLIMKINGIIDPFDLAPGTQLAIPNRMDYADYYRRYKK